MNLIMYIIFLQNTIIKDGVIINQIERINFNCALSNILNQKIPDPKIRKLKRMEFNKLEKGR